MINEHLQLTGQTAIITGASRGIGEAAAQRFARAGAGVVLLARSQAEIQQIAQSIGDHALAIACDVADWTEVEDAVSEAYSHFNRVDVLINNAGLIEPVARLGDADPFAWDQVVDVNLKGVFHGIRAVLPPMLANDTGGTIINLSSGAATGALEGWSHYCATKAAVLSLTRCVHKEYAQQGIRCVGLSPGTVATDMQRTIAASGVNPVSQLDWSQHIPASDVAEALLWLCSESARSHDGGDFTLKTEESRRAVGLV